MEIQEAVLKFRELGRMPEDTNVPDDLYEDLFNKYYELFDLVKEPINFEEAKILVQLFPEDSFGELEWTLLHTFETVTGTTDAEYLSLIELCPSEEWRETLSERYANGKEYEKELNKLRPKAMSLLKELGRIPEEQENNPEIYKTLLDTFEKPISQEQAGFLIQLFPDSYMNGLAFTLIRLIESLYPHISREEYLLLLEKCPAEFWKDLLKKRLNIGKTGNQA